MIEHILFPTDGSDNSLSTLNYVIELATKLSAEVTVMHAFEFPVYTESIPTLKLETQMDLKSMENALKEQSNDFINQAAQKLEAEGVKVHRVISEKRAGRAIVETAQTSQCSLIVMSSSDASPLMGSVGNYVLHEAPCPVMVIK